jgi:hypothetical protein
VSKADADAAAAKEAAASAATAPDDSREETKTAPIMDSPSLDKWDAEFAQITPQNPNPEPVKPQNEPAEPFADQNPDWVNKAADDFKNDVLKAEQDFNVAKDSLSLKPDEPGSELGDDKDGQR